MPETTTSLSTPFEIDTHLYSLHLELRSLEAKLDATKGMIFHTVGARREYRGRNLVYTISFEEAMDKAIDLAAVDSSYKGRDAQRHLARYDETTEAITAKAAEVHEIEKLYTGWNRFFVVTSSAGHIHARTSCSTCYLTTTFGWLPALSGKSEAEAVEWGGPNLCSVCFPSAPVEHQGGKLTQAQAEQLANGKSLADIAAEKAAERAAKDAKKAEKAERARQRAVKLMAKVEAAYERLGGFDAYMALPTARDMLLATNDLGLQTTVEDVLHDDWREFHGERRYTKNPRALLEEVA